jgi:hypothetical protein
MALEQKQGRSLVGPHEACRKGKILRVFANDAAVFSATTQAETAIFLLIRIVVCIFWLSLPFDLAAFVFWMIDDR